MTIDTIYIEKMIKQQLSQDFPDFHSEIEPRIENKIEIKEKEVVVNSPLPPAKIQTVIPKVNIMTQYCYNFSVC